MTHRNNHLPTNAALLGSRTASPRASIASKLSYLVFVVVLITVLPGAGFGYV